MKTLFIHVFEIINDNKEAEGWISEQKPITTLDEAIEMYGHQKDSWNEYQHTLMISYTENIVESVVQEINILDFINEPVAESFKPDCERLTGHEMGVCKGRV